jgi:hypothetical protein
MGGTSSAASILGVHAVNEISKIVSPAKREVGFALSEFICFTLLFYVNALVGDRESVRTWIIAVIGLGEYDFRINRKGGIPFQTNA